MPFDPDPEGLSRALRDAADSFATPSPEIQYAQAVERGRRMRRHGAVLTGLGSALMVGVAGALAFPYLGHHQPESVSTAAAAQAAGQPAADGSVSPGVTGAGGTGDGSATAGASLSAITGAYMIQSVLAALPASIAMSVVSGDLATGDAPAVDVKAGYWIAAAKWSVTTGHGSTGYSFTVEYPTASALDSCLGELVAQPHDTCIETPMDGGILVLDKTRTDPAAGTGQYIWKYTWVRPDGRQESLKEAADSLTGFALTTPEATSLLTAKAWNLVADALPPAVCPTQMSTGVASRGTGAGTVVREIFTCPANGATVQATAS